jgi:hypothetical protein
LSRPQGAAARGEPRLQLWLRVLGLAALAAPLCWPLIEAGVYVGNGSDLYSYQFPLRATVRRMLLDGELPLWNPWMLGGVPMLAGWQVGLLYPGTWLTILLPPGLGLDLDRALHGIVLLSGALALGNARLPGRLLRPTTSGLAVAALIGGAGVTWGHIYAGHVSFLASWAWQPWIFALALRATTRRDPRALCLTAAAFAMGLLAGHPQVATYGAFALTFVLIAQAFGGPAAATDDAQLGGLRRRLLRNVGVGAIVGLVGAWLALGQLAPTAALLPALNRSLASPSEIALSFSPPLGSLLTALAPHAFGAPALRAADFGWHEAVGALSPGLLALALAASFSRRGWLLAVGLAAFVALVPGRHGGLLEALIGVIPGLDAFRVPSRWWVAATLVVAVLLADALAELGVDGGSAASATATSNARPRAVALRWLPPALLAAAAMTLAFTLTSETPWWRAAMRVEDSGTLSEIATEASGRLALAAVGAAIAAFAVAREAMRRWLVTLLLIAGVADAAALAASVMEPERVWPTSRLDWSPPLASRLATEVGVDGRLTTAPRLRHADRGGAHRVAVAGGYETTMPAWTNRFLNLANGRSERSYQVNLQLRRHSPWLDRMAVTHLLRSPNDGATAQRFARFSPVANVDGLVLARSPSALPRLSLAPRREVEPDRARAIARLGALAGTTVLVDRAMRGEAAAGKLAIAAARNDAIDIDVELAEDGVVILRDVMLEGWTADVDGVPAPIAIADGLFRAVEVPAGTHRLRFAYQPPGLVAGLALAALAWLLLGLVLLRLRKNDALRLP